MTDNNIIRERDIVEKLADKISSQYLRTFTHINLANRKKFRQLVSETIGYVPVMNEIDLILLDKNHRLMAVEIKLYRVRNGSFTRPFYDGIGQALSLLRYGFDNVALWHLFLDEIDQQKFDRYGANAWWFIRNELKLPIEFSYFNVINYPDNPQFFVMQYTGPTTGSTLCRIDDPAFKMTWKYPNPLYCADQSDVLKRESIILRQTIEQLLGISCDEQ